MKELFYKLLIILGLKKSSGDLDAHKRPSDLDAYKKHPEIPDWKREIILGLIQADYKIRKVR